MHDDDGIMTARQVGGQREGAVEEGLLLPLIKPWNKKRERGGGKKDRVRKKGEKKILRHLHPERKKERRKRKME